MNKEGLVCALSQRTQIEKSEADDVVDAVFKIIADTLQSGESVKIVGFGTFEVKDRAPRMGRNPKTNMPVIISARKMPSFRPGKPLKEIVNIQTK